LFSAAIAALIMPLITGVSDDHKYPLNDHIANFVWILSLLASLSCALVALTVQRWARTKMRTNSPRYGLPEQARLDFLFSVKIRRFNSLVNFLHCLVHLSFFFFVYGLDVFLFNVNPIAGSIVETWGLVILAVYLLWALISVKSIVIVAWEFLRHLKDNVRLYFLEDMKFAQKMVQKSAPKIDGHILKSTFEVLSMRSDDDLERFFEAIPGFCVSKLVENPRRSLDILGQERLAEMLVGFWNRTVSSDRSSKSVKARRLIVCVRVIEAADLSIAVPQILHLISGDFSRASRSVEIGHSLGPLRNGNAASLARGIIAYIILDAERNGRWFALTVGELSISRDILRDYLTHGNSVLLVNLIHLARHFFDSLLQPDSDITRMSLCILPSVSKFDILNTLPRLQHDFCALWNEVVRMALDGGADNNPFIDILVEIRHLYLALHDTDATVGYFFTPTTGHDDPFRQLTSYPLCMMPGHHPNSATRTKETDGSTTLVGGFSQVTTTTSSIPSESSPGDDVLDMLPYTATVITQGIADCTIVSMTQPIADSPSL